MLVSKYIYPKAQKKLSKTSKIYTHTLFKILLIAVGLYITPYYTEIWKATLVQETRQSCD